MIILQDVIGVDGKVNDMIYKNFIGGVWIESRTASKGHSATFENINLNAMKTIKDSFKIDIGYSDHSLGIEVPIAATSLGAKVIEKHFTLDKEMEGPDHKASLNPQELKMMVSAIRNIEASLGSFEKKPSKVELENITAARKSIIASCKIKQGDTFSPQNITTKRPGTGISPMKINEVYGKLATKDFTEDELITL